MNRYESVILVKPTLNEEELNNIKNKFFTLVKDNGGKMLLNESEYGFVLKKTAYEVKKFNKAQYLVFQFEADAECVDELNRVYRITDEVIKYIIVKINEDTKLVAKMKEDAKESKRSFKEETLDEKNEEKLEENNEKEEIKENKEEE